MLLPLMVWSLGLLSLVLAGLYLQERRSRRQAQHQAERMTSEVDRLALVARLTSNAVVITNVQRQITWVNEGFERITGYSTAEAIGQTPAHLLQFDGTDPDAILQMRAALNRGESFQGKLLNRSKHGQIYWLEIEIQPLHDRAGELIGFMAIETDITERFQVQEALRASQNLLDKTGRIGSVGGWACELATGRMDWTTQTAVLLDLEPGLTLTPAQCLAFCTPQARQQVQEAMARGFGGGCSGDGAWDVELPLLTAKGRAIWVRLIAECERVEGQPVRIIGALQDITDLVRATEAAEQASQAKSEFIATVSHELRTPLQSVIGFSELGEHFAQDQPSFQAMFTDINAGGQRMLKLVNDLLDISKFTGALVQLDLRPGDLAEVCAAVLREFEPILGQCSVHIDQPSPWPTLPVAIDRFRMQQVLRNVLANAVRFTPPGSRIRLDLADHGDKGVALSVSDEGPGIPEDELDAIFEPFTQSSRTRDGSGGTGLGLTICRKIMTAHGGHIEAANAAGRGALITLRLPALAPTPPVPQVPQDVPHETHHSDH